jgi:2-polyprenyl-6-hydroxyphenyl methylase/3-demethylubiquinone-9 3-methyltransferase
MINNAFYDELCDAWYEEDAHPIALLRAENAVRNPWILQTIKEQCCRDSRILDIGCGGGLLTNVLAKEGYRVSGIDLSKTSLDQARQRDATKSVEYTWGNARSLPYPDENFDVVCAMDFLEHVEEPAGIVREISRVLKPGGLFFFHTFNRNFLSYLLVIKCVEWLVPNVPRNMHVYPLFIKPDELKRMCSDCGLEVRSIQGLIPDFRRSSFWKSLLRRRVLPDFRFTFTKGLKVGYLGYARRV